jgi:hypothetical protein
VRHAASSSDIDHVIVSCSYAHLHLVPQWLRTQLHVTFATLGPCPPPFASVVHIPRADPSHQSAPHVAPAVLSLRAASDFSPLSQSSRTRTAALSYAACNVSASVAAAAAALDGDGAAAALAPTIVCLEHELQVSTAALQLQ